MTNSLKSKLVTVLATLLIVALFATGFAFNASSSSAETTYFAINEGAAIKIDYENDAENNLTGIRFTGTVKKELSALILADAEGDAEVGMAVMPKAVYDAFGTREQGESDDLFKYIEEEFGKSKDAIAKPYAKGLLSTTEDVEVSGRIIKILDANYNLTYRAVMYYTLDGVNYNYSDYSGDRSLIQVANAALEAGVDAEEIAPIANIIKKSLYLKDGGSLDGNALAIDLGIINASVDLSEKFSAITADDFAFSIKSGSEYVTLTDGIVSPKTTGVGTAVITATAFDGALSFDVSVSVLNTEDGELASFNSDLYEGMAVLATPNPAADAVGQEITSQEYLETYAGEASVLKINVTSGVDKQNLGHNFNVIKVKLPKAHGTNGYTLKMMIENAKYSTSGGTLFFCSSAGTQESNGNNRYVSFTGEGAKTSGVWYEIYVPATEASEYIYIAYHQGWAGGSTNYSIALSWVKD